jgi:flagellar motility protein MotE (MotC chaperone)
MKRTLPVISGTLALNFLVLIAAIAWLFYSGRLDRERVGRIKQIVFAEPATQPTTRPTDARDPTTQPSLRLEQLLAKVSGRPASEQVEFMQRTFDAQSALIDARVTELEKQRATLNAAQAQLTRDREKLAADQKRLESREQEQARLASDKGFQETLELYTTMPPRQVKTIFMTLDEPTAVRYLRSMEPRAAGKILKEFKSPDETARATRILEAMRQSQAATEQ